MDTKRIHIALTRQQQITLKKLQAKLGLDTSNTMRYCLARVGEQEGITNLPDVSTPAKSPAKR